MTKIVEIRRCEDPRDAIHQACHRLADGDLVAFPTETVYLIVANPMSSSGMQRLVDTQSHGRRSILLKSCFELWDYAPRMPILADKLSRRGWPGPLTIALQEPLVDGLFRDFSPGARSAIVDQDQRVSFRLSAQETLQQVLRLCPAPLVACSEQTDAGLMPRNAAEVAAQFGDRVALIFDDGPCRYGESSTTVAVDKQDWEVVEPGVVSDCTIKRLCSEVFLFVCTGNTCRSPMAEALFRKMLAEQLKCPDEELIDRGFNVVSAGLSAARGYPASREAITLLADEGIDLRNHESQPLTERLLLHADYVKTMTQSHRQYIVNEFPDFADRVSLLSTTEGDIPDPYGGGQREYSECKVRIEEHLRTLIDQLNLSRS